MWLKNFFQKKYSKKNVEFIISDILRQTVDRDNVSKFLKDDISPLLGDQLVQNFFEKLNEKEKTTDIYHSDYWLKKLDSIEKFGTF